MIVVNEVNIGAVARLGDLVMYRKAIMEECFTPMCIVNTNNDGLTNDSQIKVKYKEWINDVDGNEIPEFTKSKYYILKDEEVWKPVSEFLNKFWRSTPNPPENRGFGDQIENTLAHIPQDAPDCYVVKSTDFTS